MSVQSINSTLAIPRYSDFGCQKGQHCLGGVCYENATVCLCNDKDNCNDFLTGGDGQSTPHPWEPSRPADNHTCYYGNTDDDTSSLVQVQECHKGENLCVRVSGTGEDKFEFRSCWSGE